jgi:cell division protease FtsH
LKNEKRYVIVFDVKMVLCNNTRKVGSKLKKGIKTLAMWLIIGVIAIVLITSIMENRSSQITYSELITSIENGEVEKIKISSTGSQATVKMKDSKLEKEVSIPSLDSFMTYSQDYLKTGAFSLEEEKESIWITALGFITPFGLLAIFLVFWFIMMSGNNQNGTKSMTFGKSKARMINAGEKNRVTFDDVAGVDEEKEELQEIVEFLKNPKKFTDMGARIPKGVLLVGQPGTGKTLLAKAVAGEAGVPFYIISGSDFVEMFVGVGASRVRDLFEQAKKNAPCIIFIDEIDAVGRQRGAGLGGGHDEREQTLNQLLVEMDGFSDNEGVIILAATNRPDVLDKALLRAGRFDRQIVVGSPDVKAREQILEVHARKKKLADDVDLKVIAKNTSGFAGADLENVLNEAALLAARRNYKEIGMKEIEDAMVKVTMGPEKKTRVRSEKENRLVAYHEAGHAVVSRYLPTQDPVHQISIIPRGMAGGYTMYRPTEDKSFMSKTEMEENIVSLLGGRVAEALILNDISTGASNDIERASQIARNMVTKYGMSEKVGTVMFGGGEGEVFLGRDFAQTKDYSEETAALIDEEVKRIVQTAYEKAVKILTEHVDKLHAVAGVLMEKEKIEGEEFDNIFKE